MSTVREETKSFRNERMLADAVSMDIHYPGEENQQMYYGANEATGAYS